MAKDLIISLLDSDRHDRIAFDCGEPALNEYLRNTARQHLQKGIANTYVLASRAEPETILGFFTLSFLEVDISEIPAGYGKKLPQSRLPAAKLGRLAIDKSCQGNTAGFSWPKPCAGWRMPSGTRQALSVCSWMRKTRTSPNFTENSDSSLWRITFPSCSPTRPFSGHFLTLCLSSRNKMISA